MLITVGLLCANVRNTLEELTVVRLSDRVIVITGATGGLGNRFAKEFSNYGSSLALFGRNLKALEELAGSLPVRTLPICCDVTNERQMEEGFEKVAERFGKVDSVLANAGALLSPGRAESLPLDVWCNTIEVNLTGSWITARAAHPYLREAEMGQLAFVSSRASSIPTRGICAYAAAKAGVEGLVRSLAVEWARDNICVNAVSPGLIDEGATRSISENAKRGISDRTVLRRRGAASDLFGAVSLFIGGDARYITGQVLAVDGGYGLR